MRKIGELSVIYIILVPLAAQDFDELFVQQRCENRCLRMIINKFGENILFYISLVQFFHRLCCHFLF